MGRKEDAFAFTEGRDERDGVTVVTIVIGRDERDGVTVVTIVKAPTPRSRFFVSLHS
jgi:hypothetical protein